jgi:flagellar basal-body rod protein FlgF
MIRGLYTSATGMQIQKDVQQVLADNLANASTSGFKSYDLIHKVHAEKKISNSVTGDEVGMLTYGSETYDTTFDFSQGPLRQTGNPLDIAISGPGFFAVQDHQGKVAYSRNGHFTLDQDGFLVNQAGDLVLDSGFAPIYVGNQGVNSINILKTGTVMINGEFNTVLKAYTFPEGTAILRQGNDKFMADSQNISMNLANDSLMNQGFIEASNVSTIKSATEMVQVMRTYEANQKAIQAQADTIEMLMRVSDGI